MLTSFQIFADHMNENDLVVLEKLQDITCTLLDPSSDESEEEKTWGYVLTFVFEPNEHFEETELTKTYIFHDAEESDLKKTEGFKINWKPGAADRLHVWRVPVDAPHDPRRACAAAHLPCGAGKDPTKKVVKKKGRRGAVQRKTVPVESFFNFFSPPQIPSDYKSMDDTLAQVRALSCKTPANRGKAIESTSSDAMPCIVPARYLLPQAAHFRPTARVLCAPTRRRREVCAESRR